MTSAKKRDVDAVPVTPTEAQLQAAADRKLAQTVDDHAVQIADLETQLGAALLILNKSADRIAALEEAVTNTSQKLTNMRQGIKVPHVRDEDNIRT